VPISGGTMFIPEDQDYAIIADPDTDQVHRVAFGAETGGLHEATLALEPGDEPGRVVGKDGRYFVALRGAGAVIRLDADLVIDERFSVCSSPRGLYFDGEAGELLVACLEGDLVRLDALGQVRAVGAANENSQRHRVVGRSRVPIRELTGGEFVSTVKGIQLVRERFPERPVVIASDATWSADRDQLENFRFDTISSALINAMTPTGGDLIITPIAAIHASAVALSGSLRIG